MATRRPACPTYSVFKESVSCDLLRYDVVSRPTPERPKGMHVTFIDVPQVLGFDTDAPVTKVSEDARKKISTRRTTPRSTKKASDPS
jgi:hypothetical protein